MTMAAAIEEFRVGFPASQFFTDLCNLIAPTSVPDGFGGSTQTDTVVASNVPCSIRAMKSPMQVEIGGGRTVTLGHEIRLKADAATKLIKPHYKIVILAHHNEPEKTAWNPVTLDGSTDVFVVVGAAIHE